MRIDGASRRNLEIEVNLSGAAEGTLIALLDRCTNPMGGRLLRRWLHGPLIDHDLIRARLAAVETLSQDRLYETILDVCRQIGDVERITARIALQTARPRDLAGSEATGVVPGAREPTVAPTTPVTRTDHAVRCDAPVSA